MTAAAIAVTATAVVFAPSSALGRALIHVVRAGDTVESLAAEYYGNRALALFIAEDNAIKRGQKLRPGQKVRVPTAFTYRVRKGDTLEAIALRLLDDRRRAALLATMSGIKPTDKLHPGQELLVPFQHVHRAAGPETLAAVAQTFYGDAGRARLLADYNFRTSTSLARGERIVVPISHVRVRAVRVAQTASTATQGKAPMVSGRTPVIPEATAAEAQRREAELAERVRLRLVEAEAQYVEGNYAAVPALLDKLLTEEEPSESQLAEVFRWKAFAYVALGQEDLAVSAFREVLARAPALRLDEATVSPKIRVALEQARRAAP